MLEYLTVVRDKLQEAFGDHMVASTVFAKRIRTIVECYDVGADPVDVARTLWDTEFAGLDGYEK